MATVPAIEREPGSSRSFERDEQIAKRFHRARRIVGLASWLVSTAFIVAFLWTGATSSLRDLAFRVFKHPALALLFYAAILGGAMKLLHLPASFYRGFHLERRYGLSRQSFFGWAKDHLKASVLSALLGLGAVEIIYFTLHRYPEFWWAIVAAIFSLFVLALSQLAPVLLFPLFFKFKPLENANLQERLQKLCERANTHVRGVWEWNLGEKSTRANAALVGWGKTRRIILADTLLEDYSPDEIQSILAHELGHHVHADIWRELALESALTFASFYAAHQVLVTATPWFGFAGLADFANLPLLMLVGTALSFAALPMANAFSRHRERAADRFALKMTRDRKAFISSMEKLGWQNLAEPRPNRLIEFVFYSHPSVEKRLALAREMKF
jgi:STE24 endopeptidase